MLQAVCDEARYILIAKARLLADLCHEIHNGLGSFVCCCVGLNHFYQRNQVARIPEVCAAETLAMLEVPADFRRAHNRCVGAEDTVRSAAGFEFCECFTLQIHVFEYRFDHKVCVLDTLAVNIRRKVDSGKSLLKFLFTYDSFFDQLFCALLNACRHVHLVDVVNCNLIVLYGGNHESNVLAHQSSAHDKYVFNVCHDFTSFPFRIYLYCDASFTFLYIGKSRAKILTCSKSVHFSIFL